MLNKLNSLALITARSGSKRLKNKNILDFNDNPLIATSITEALKSKYIDEVIISTDDQQIADIAKTFGGSVFFKRPSSLAEDESSSISVVLHAINELGKMNKHYKHLILLQPTSPLRKSYHIDEAIELYNNYKADCLISISEASSKSQMKNFLCIDEMSNDYIKFANIKKRDIKNYSKFRINGALYLVKIDLMQNQKSIILKSNTFAYIMDKKFSIDIDTESDFRLAEEIIKNSQVS